MYIDIYNIACLSFKTRQQYVVINTMYDCFNEFLRLYASKQFLMTANIRNHFLYKDFKSFDEFTSATARQNIYKFTQKDLKNFQTNYYIPYNNQYTLNCQDYTVSLLQHHKFIWFNYKRINESNELIKEMIQFLESVKLIEEV